MVASEMQYPNKGTNHFQYWTHQAETRTTANISPLALEHDLLSSGKTPHAPALHRTSFPQWGWRVQAASRAKHVHHRTNSRSMFINMYKSVTGTWNVFGWNNPTLQDHVFTEWPGPGRFSRQWSWFLVSRKMESCRIRHQPKPPSQDKIQDCSDAICWVCLW